LAAFFADAAFSTSLCLAWGRGGFLGGTAAYFFGGFCGAGPLRS
jgi:hypothetical protein